MNSMVMFHSYVNIYQRVTTEFSQMFIVDIYIYIELVGWGL